MAWAGTQDSLDLVTSCQPHPSSRSLRQPLWHPCCLCPVPNHLLTCLCTVRFQNIAEGCKGIAMRTTVWAEKYRRCGRPLLGFSSSILTRIRTGAHACPCLCTLSFTPPSPPSAPDSCYCPPLSWALDLLVSLSPLLYIPELM